LSGCTTDKTTDSLDTKFPKRRQKAADLARRSLEDKSSNVRRNAIKLITKLIVTHPFAVLHGGTLKHSEWQNRLEILEKDLDVVVARMETLGSKASGAETADPEVLQDATENDNEQNQEGPQEAQPRAREALINDAQEANKLQLTRRYYVEALRFIDSIHAASEMVTQLLSAKNKSEVIEAMDFFKTLDVHKVETAKVRTGMWLRGICI
jgi:condensin complex subunit 1